MTSKAGLVENKGMDSDYVPPPGTFGLSKISGVLGFLIALAQLITGHTSLFTHAFVVLDGERVLEAMPSGARVQALGHRLRKDPIVWSWAVPLTEEQRRRIVAEAEPLVGVPYSFLDYLSLLLLHLHLRPEWVKARVRTSGHMICSQLVDEVYNRAGVELFDDGRYCGDVMPGDLANLLMHARYAR